MQLSKRLSAVAGMVTFKNRLVDVGTDHGYIPIYLMEQGVIQEAIAMDINKGPLERAREHIRESGMEDRIETRLSDGVAMLKPGEGDSLIIAGMGGGLVRKIMSEGEEVLKEFREYILQPQSEIESVRRFLLDRGYRIVEENMIEEDGKYYPMMKAVRGEEKYDRDIFFKYGRLLLESRNPVLKAFLEKERESLCRLEKRLSEQAGKNAVARLEEIRREIAYVKEAFTYYEEQAVY